MIFKLFSAGALMFLGVACTSCEKENENNKESDIPMEQVSYKASNEIIVNPERGFYKATSCEMGISGALSVSTLKNYRANGYSLIFRYFYLKNFRDDNKYVEVAFFGGSFTAIEKEKQIELLEAAQEYIESKQVNSIRISTRPDCIDKEILKRMKKYL